MNIVILFSTKTTLYVIEAFDSMQVSILKFDTLPYARLKTRATILDNTAIFQIFFLSFECQNAFSSYIFQVNSNSYLQIKPEQQSVNICHANINIS